MANSAKVNSAVARATRTGIQGTPAWALTEGIDAFLVDLSDRQYGIAVVLLTILISFIQNTIENGFGKAILRVPTNEGTPVVGEDHNA